MSLLRIFVKFNGVAIYSQLSIAKTKTKNVKLAIYSQLSIAKKR